MRAFRSTLVALAIAFAAVAALHFLLGLGADRLLGIELDDAVIASPGLSSQNRFFGTSYLLYAVVLCLAARDVERYRPILLAVLPGSSSGNFSPDPPQPGCRAASWSQLGLSSLGVNAAMASASLLTARRYSLAQATRPGYVTPGQQRAPHRRRRGWCDAATQFRCAVGPNYARPSVGHPDAAGLDHEPAVDEANVGHVGVAAYDGLLVVGKV
jgi:hypothetical protein